MAFTDTVRKNFDNQRMLIEEFFLKYAVPYCQSLLPNNDHVIQLKHRLTGEGGQPYLPYLAESTAQQICRDHKKKKSDNKTNIDILCLNKKETSDCKGADGRG